MEKKFKGQFDSVLKKIQDVESEAKQFCIEYLDSHGGGIYALVPEYIKPSYAQLIDKSLRDKNKFLSIYDFHQAHGFVVPVCGVKEEWEMAVSKIEHKKYDNGKDVIYVSGRGLGEYCECFRQHHVYNGPFAELIYGIEAIESWNKDVLVALKEKKQGVKPLKKVS